MIIELSYRKVRVCTSDGRFMTVREILTYHNGCSRKVQDIEEYGDLESVRLVFRFGRFSKDIPMSPELERGILAYLEAYHAKQDLGFDCYAFVNLVHGIQRHHVRAMRWYWCLGPLRSWPHQGDVIFLVNEDETRFRHAAIYLGMGLYLSVWGAGGDIEVATLRDMKSGFDSRVVLIARPRL